MLRQFLSLIIIPLYFVVNISSSVNAQESDLEQQDKKLKIILTGASLTGNLYKGITDNPTEFDSQFTYINEAVGSSGIVRDDFFNWPEAIEQNLSVWNADYIIMFVGSNDNQSILSSEDGKRYKPNTEQWQKEYRRRVKLIMQSAQEKNIKLLWVSLPIMKFSRLNQMALQANKISLQESNIHNAYYLDLWDVFSDEQGRYSRRGPDIQGQIRVLRSSDGVHFNNHGRAQLAFFVREKLEEIIKDSQDNNADLLALEDENLTELNQQEVLEEEYIIADELSQEIGPVLTLFPAWQPPKISKAKKSDNTSSRYLLYVQGGVLPYQKGRSDDFFIGFE